MFRGQGEARILTDLARDRRKLTGYYWMPSFVHTAKFTIGGEQMRIFDRFGAEARKFFKVTILIPACTRSLLIVVILVPIFAQTSPIPASIADSVGSSLNLVEGQLLSIAEAMPEAKCSFIPSGCNFDGVRSFGEQVKHAACAQFPFFNEIEGKTPPAECEKSAPSKPGTKAD
jgi:hypothetical protein